MTPDKTKFNSFTIEQVERACDKSSTLREIGEKLGCTTTTARNLLLKYKLDYKSYYRRTRELGNRPFVLPSSPGLTNEQQKNNELMFKIKLAMINSVENDKPFEPVMEDFFGEKGMRFYKRELPITTISMNDYLNGKR